MLFSVFVRLPTLLLFLRWLSCSSQSGPPPCRICSLSQTRLMKAHRVQVTTKQPWKQSEARFSLQNTPKTQFMHRKEAIFLTQETHNCLITIIMASYAVHVWILALSHEDYGKLWCSLLWSLHPVLHIFTLWKLHFSQLQEYFMLYWFTYVDNISRGSVSRELTDPVNRQR